MSELYQQLDAPAFDYELVAVPGISNHLFRGPLPDLSAPYFAVVGGAQAFGRFVADPFPARLSRALGMPCLDLGLGGAGPRFATDPQVLPLLQRARFVVVQCFAGRSASNSLFDNASAARNTGRYLRTGERITFERFLDEILARDDLPLLQRIVHETRDDYAVQMRHLAQQLRVPTVLLWLSRRAPDYTIDWSHPHGILNSYPQLLDRSVVDRLRAWYPEYVECASAAGLPQRLWRADEPVLGSVHRDGWLWNEYYPSPEMHERAAEGLVEVCRRVLGG